MNNKIISLAKYLKNNNLHEEANHVSYLFFKVADSQGNIINLGYPEILAQIIQEKFGKNSYLVANWIKEYHNYGTGDKWLTERLGGILSGWRGGKINHLLDMYHAATQGIETYLKFLNDNEYYTKDLEFMTESDLIKRKNLIANEIKETLFNDIFFYNSFAKAILNGEIQDLRPYKKLSFEQASDKYNEKKIFKDAAPFKVYPNGYKWINVGPKCEIVGKQMNNCGSAGVMSMDEDKTIFVLFDKNNNPHIITTYSPNENRLSGVEGKASSSPKEDYHEYILDLVDSLNAYLDFPKLNSLSLTMKYLFKNIANLEKLNIDTSPFNEFFKLTTPDNTSYISNGYSSILESEITEAYNLVKQNPILKEHVKKYIFDEINLNSFIKFCFTQYADYFKEFNLTHILNPRLSKILKGEKVEEQPKVWL